MRPAVVRTFLTEARSRDFTDGPGTDLGLVRFGGWQIHPVPSAEYTQDAYLLRVNIDIVLDPGTARPGWVEAGFDFATAGVAVLDAVPRVVRSAEPARQYRLSPTLNFLPARAGEPADRPIGLDPQAPEVDAYGTGGPGFSWRWSAGGGVAPGHRGGWLVLLAPAGTGEVRLRPWAAFAPPPGSGRRPGCDPVDRVVALPRPGNRRTGAQFAGRAALEFTRRLGDSWLDLATVLAVPAHARARFGTGRQAHDLWQWLEIRDELATLPDALEAIDRPDLAKLFRDLT